MRAPRRSQRANFAVKVNWHGLILGPEMGFGPGPACHNLGSLVIQFPRCQDKSNAQNRVNPFASVLSSVDRSTSCEQRAELAVVSPGAGLWFQCKKIRGHIWRIPCAKWFYPKNWSPPHRPKTGYQPQAYPTTITSYLNTTFNNSTYTPSKMVVIFFFPPT